MKCANGHRMYVIDSRQSGSNTRRSYKCNQCGERISTLEVKLIGPRGTSAYAKRKRDSKLFLQRGMLLKASIDQLLDEAKRLLGDKDAD